MIPSNWANWDSDRPVRRLRPGPVAEAETHGASGAVGFVVVPAGRSDTDRGRMRHLPKGDTGPPSITVRKPVVVEL